MSDPGPLRLALTMDWIPSVRDVEQGWAVLPYGGRFDTLRSAKATLGPYPFPHLESHRFMDTQKILDGRPAAILSSIGFSSPLISVRA